jgi:peptidyl-prolyl cis-trans isomerase C
MKTSLYGVARTVLFAALSFLAACGTAQDTPRQQARSLTDDDVAAIVNGTRISTLQVQRHAAQRGSGDAPGDPAQATEELINMLLLSQEAVRQSLHEQPATIEELARQEIAVLASALIDNQVATMQIDEAELRAEYALQIASMEDTEYRARHILLSEQELANEIIRQLRLDADFAELARQQSAGPDAQQGGELGWFRAGAMPPAFSQALQRMQIGEVSKPVITRFGWHVIQLQDKRKAPVPEFATVTEKLQVIVRNKRLRELIDNLRANAEIELQAAN